ncbi:HipA N-terminal domain-containing protein [Acidithiobacillus caldus]|uniref:HipA N-terminal domain-containing protein n=1 Tax=Acidithiobacillus caldus TaxID=33059 RepID=UPI001F2CB551|nr:HipA N-terminal domain-containing protein [Acidithiobacillus caldus]
MSDARVLQVCIGDPAIEVGTLWLSSAGGRNFSAFQYSAAWLRHPRAFALSPDLPLSSEKWFFHGDPQVAHSSSLPPPLADTIPDAWGHCYAIGKVLRSAPSSRVSRVFACAGMPTGRGPRKTTVKASVGGGASAQGELNHEKTT